MHAAIAAGFFELRLWQKWDVVVILIQALPWRHEAKAGKRKSNAKAKDPHGCRG